MTTFEAIFLGIVQGITEFLPISSSGHLILGRSLLGGVENSETLAFDILLHLITALVILIYFKKDILNLLKSGYKAWIIILIGIIPAGAVGFFFGDVLAEVFRSNVVVVVMLLIGSLLMAVGELVGKKNEEKARNNLPKPIQALVVGLFQILSLIPGTSRSGSTIAGGLISGLSRHNAAKFSFVMGLPLILAAGGAKFIDLLSAPEMTIQISNFVWGSIAAFISGMLAVHWLMKMVAKQPLWPFIWYRVIMAVVLIFFLV